MNRRILLICKEGFSWPIHYLAKTLRKEGHEIAAFFIMPHESLRNDYDYREFLRLNPDLKIFTAKELGASFLKKLRAGPIILDWEDLNRIESTYCRLKTLGLQQVSSQFMSTYAHYRTYYHDVPGEQQLLLMQLYYQLVEKVLGEFNPDVIYDADFSEYPRAIIYEVAEDRGIPYITLESSRYKDYFFPSTTLAMKDADWLSPIVQTRVSLLHTMTDRSGRDGYKALAEFRKAREILAPGFKVAYETTKFKPVRAAYNLARSYFRNIPIQIRDWFLHYRMGTSPIFADPLASNLLELKEYLRKVLIAFSSPFESVDLSKLSFILFPLHLIPESSTLTKAPFFLNEEFLIESLSKSLRPGQKIVVKEHWYMLGERPLSFYRRLKRLPNVILIEPRKYGDPRAYLEHAEGVVTITGSSAFEAALLGKPAIAFGPTPFSMLSSIKSITDVTLLPTIVRNWAVGLAEDVELEAYLEVAMELGETLDMPMLTSRENEVDVEKATQQATRLYVLFKRGEEIKRNKQYPLHSND